MKKITRKSVLVMCFFCASLLSLNAQEKSKKVSNDLTRLLDVSSSYKNYKVIEKGAISNFQSTLNNYIRQEQNTQASLRKELKVNEDKILGLQNQMDELKKSNEVLLNEKASISFLGFLIDKKNYSIVMWTLFIGTLLVSLVLLFKFKAANKITNNSKSLLKDLEKEYDSYRRVCIEREQNLRRQLFEEAKKNKELMNAS
ncbi:hypothetical protein LXD69_06830 [Flavobacterium sediminilitoris]|uniref:tRNA (Guanine-N1)-methyltransferase n=1 Tax=Flavobacterium sediminilitoris TaxID=2024526 RepID=A0ABY4HU17_9FLAO|nr:MULTISPECIES: hypothetical protein [Flavobacterium]UOX35224.1 hypothetical protein LXD69_06830 [Flavobacterium sediminilitoris]